MFLVGVRLQECHCMLFLTADNPFAGKEQNITMEEVRRNELRLLAFCSVSVQGMILLPL